MRQPSKQLARLTGLVEIRHGFAFASEFFANAGDYILLTPGNFRETGGYRDPGAAQKRYSGPVPPNFILQEGDVLIAMTEQSPGLLGSTIKVPSSGTYLHNQRLGLLIVRDPSRAYANYLYHVFNAPYVRKEISSGAAGTKVKHTSPSKILAVEIYLPSIAEQQRIARLLDEWDVAIEKIEQLIAAKERHRDALISHLYTTSDTNGTKSPLGKLLRESTEVGSSGRSARKLTVKLYGKGVIAKSDRRQGSHQTQYFVRRAGQLIYSKLDFLNGAFGIIPTELDGYESTLDLPAFNITRTVNPVWLLGYLTRPTYYTRQVGLARGQRKARRVHPSDLLASSLRVPPRKIQDRIADALTISANDISLTKDFYESLQAQKRGLMQKLLTGEWRLPLPEQGLA